MANTAGVAARYRPRRLSDVVGQKHATVVLQAALRAGRVPQQLLFSGGSGLGKTTLARIVAAALLCQSPVDGDACGACAECNAVAAGTHPDVIELDAASHGGKDDVRDMASRAQVLPVRARQKVYIVDEVHGLSRPGGEAFLKLLEEPPPHVVFMLATTDPQKMARANRGRCVEFALHTPTPDELAAHVLAVATQEGLVLDADAADAVVAAADLELGVRGVLMGLERVLALVATGASPGDATAAALGTPDVTQVRAVGASVAAGDEQHAARHAQLLCESSPASAVRAALVRWAYQRVTHAQSDLELAVAVQQLDLLLAATTEPASVVVAAARAAAAVPPGLRTALATDASASATLGPDAPGAQLAPLASGTPLPANVGAPVLAAHLPPELPETSVVTESLNSPALGATKSDPSANQTDKAEVAFDVPALVESLRARSRIAAAAVNSAAASFDGTTLTLSGPSLLVDRLATHHQLIADAAGVPVVVGRAEASLVEPKEQTQ